MPWPPDIADELPAPRDDEPSSLRQDIADELADHLQTSFTRELHSTPEESSAKQNVLDRFGDPRRVARTLWFDAMKEKLMSQRLNLLFSSLMSVACLGALGLMTLMLRDSREVNAAILEKLAALTALHPAPQPAQSVEATPQSMDWVRPKFKLVSGEKGGPPAVGFKVRMQGDAKTPVLGEIEHDGHFLAGAVEETTGADGAVDLGLFRFGSYNLTVTSPWGETTNRQIGLRPGQEPVREIVCPVGPPQEFAVIFNVDWPEDLRGERLWLLCNIEFPATRQLTDGIWSTVNTQFFAVHSSEGGRIVSESLVVNAEGLASTCSRVEQRYAASIIFQAPAQFAESIRLPELTFRIASVTVVKPDGEAGFHAYPVLASCPPSSRREGDDESFRVENKGQPTARSPSGERSFEPKLGQANRWTIKLPDYMLDDLRSKLKLKPNPADVENVTPETN
jgi:hypothetical protein